MPQGLSAAAEKLWKQVYEEALKEHDKETAVKIAMAAVKKAGLDGGTRSDSDSVFRWDRGTFKPTRLPNGWLKADASLTRTGVFAYRNQDGTTRRELRLPDDVFKRDSMDSLQLVPLTLRHPPEPLDAQNTREHSVGAVGSDIHHDDALVRATLMVTDADAVKAVETGSHRELSCGYNCVLDHTPGEWNGQRYDAVQHHIRYNHVALEPLGRAGPDVRVHMDAAEMVNDEPRQLTLPQEGLSMSTKITLDGVTYEVTEQAAQAIGVMQQRHDEAVKAATEEAKAGKTESDKLQAKFDAQAEELKKAAQERDVVSMRILRQHSDHHMGLALGAPQLALDALPASIPIDDLAAHATTPNIHSSFRSIWNLRP